jgi:acetone carboxylase alpha subunit
LVNYKHRATESDIKDRINRRESIPRGDDYDLENPDIANLRGNVELGILGDHVPHQMKEFGLYEHHWLGGGGLGDPLDRDPESVAHDLCIHHTNPSTAERVYGVVAEHDEKNDEWRVEPEKTSEKRERMRKERVERAIPFEKWRSEQRQKVLKRSFSPVVVEMYKGTMSLSDKFSRRFREFWDLPEDFVF